MSASFDEPNLVSAAGLVPVMKLAENAGLQKLADKWLNIPTDKGANAGLKVASLVGGMVAGADSLDDMALLRHGGMRKLFTGCYAPSTLGSFLRSFTFGHVRQLDAIAARFLGSLAAHSPIVSGIDDYALVDSDDTIIEVHGYQKQGAGFGYSGVRGLNALLATVTTTTTAPVIIAQRLRKGSCGSPRGAVNPPGVSGHWVPGIHLLVWGALRKDWCDVRLYRSVRITDRGVGRFTPRTARAIGPAWSQ